MRVLSKIGKVRYLCRYKTAIRIQSCLFMLIFLVSCVDGRAFSDFSLLNKKSVNDDVKPALSDTKKGKDDNNITMFAPVKKVKTETLLDAKGIWNLVEKSKTIDPMQAHLMARKKVNTKRRKYNKDLSPHFKPDAKSGEDGKMRVVRLEPNDNFIDEFEIAESALTKPEHTVVEGDILQKIKALFGEDDENSKSYATIIPRRKPASHIRVVGAGGKSPNKDWSFFSKDKEFPKDKEVKPVQNKIFVTTKANKNLKPKPKPINYEGHMIGGIVIPPGLPDRKNVDLVALSASEVINEDAVLSAVEGDKKPVYFSSKTIVIPKRKPANASKFSASAINKIISNTSDKKDKRVGIALENKDSRASVIRLRSGKHPDRIRIVIEVTRTTKYKVMVDHIRKVLRIKLYNTRWGISPQESFKKSDLLGSYVAREQKDGSTIFEVRLKKETKILDTMILRPNLSSKHRVVIDLK